MPEKQRKTKDTLLKSKVYSYQKSGEIKNKASFVEDREIRTAILSSTCVDFDKIIAD